jgi:acrylyl-CoA reductase (NADPH)
MSVRALVLRTHPDDAAAGATRAPSVAIEQLDDADLPDGDVTIDVACSSLNYKDALVVTGAPGLVRTFPHVPGIDLAGRVVDSRAPGVAVGSDVLVTGCWLGERHWGGMATRARVPADWVVMRPDGCSAERAMALGTAGFTAQLAVDALTRGGVSPGEAPVLVTGATGGVGAIAVLLLAHAGHEVEASTGRNDDPAAVELLRALGAARVIGRDEVSSASGRPLATARWSGVVDVAGGATLAGALAQTRPAGVVAACGLADDTRLATSVMPFIIRGVTLTGIDSVLHPMHSRPAVWQRLHAAVDDALLARLTRTVPLGAVASAARALLDGGGRGRTVVDVHG